MVRLPVELNAFTLKGAGLLDAFPVPKSQGLVGTTRFCASTTAQKNKPKLVFIIVNIACFMVKRYKERGLKSLPRLKEYFGLKIFEWLAQHRHLF